MNFICKKTNKPDSPIPFPPLKGPLGQWLIDNIGQKAWALWQEQQTKLINENRLDPTVANDKEQIKAAMIQYFNIPTTQQAKE